MKRKAGVQATTNGKGEREGRYLGRYLQNTWAPPQVPRYLPTYTAATIPAEMNLRQVPRVTQVRLGKEQYEYCGEKL